MAGIDTTGMGDGRRAAAVALMAAREDVTTRRAMLDRMVPTNRLRIAVLASGLAAAERALAEAEAAFAATEERPEGGDDGTR